MAESFLEGLSEHALAALPYLFEFWALPHQIEPEGDWRSWVILGGRGAGKTRAGAEWVRAQVEGPRPLDPGRCSHVALVGETLDQVREVMVFGPSGILACCPPDRQPEWQASRRRLVWPNGAIAQVFSAHDPDSLRGPQFDAAWVDELAKWKRAEAAWDMLQFALRLGDHPRQVVTTTPKNVEVLKRILDMPSTSITTAPTEANRAYLAASFLEEIRVRYAGTRLGRQELDGVLLADVDGALWATELLEKQRVDEIPPLDRIVVAVDPPVTGHKGSDECGIVVAGVSTYRYFVLHNAALCAAAGGIDAFCIGSEMRSLTQIRDSWGYPAVAALMALAADVRSILGPSTKIGYAADWSEYFGHHPQDGSGDVIFHLDPLWSDPNIDFIGIDNYMPQSDWRAGIEHEDAPQGSIYSLDYLKSNVAGGEGFDWYYRNEQERLSQLRSPIEDGASGEPWVFRYKDLKSWWSKPHHNRIGGIRQAGQTSWVPQSKPIWFTEVGCPAIEKGTNQPNKFVDLLSSESEVPYFSNGRRDDLIQFQYLRALLDHWGDAANNPVSTVYGGPMVDVSKTHAWAWDTRPWPQFPNNTALWADGPSYLRGHWVSGRLSAQPLSEVVAEICQRSGVFNYDVSELFGLVRGFELREISSARAALQPLMLVHGFDVIEREGKLVFRSRREEAAIEVSDDAYALAEALEGTLEQARTPEAELAGRVQLNYLEHGGDYAVRTAEAVFPDETSPVVSQSDFPMVLNSVEAMGTVERWLAEARVARENVRFALPLSRVDVRAGDLVELQGGALYRVDRLEIAEARIIEATRVSSSVYEASDGVEKLPPARPVKTPLPVFPAFLDLPLLTGDEVPHAPWLAVTGEPWPGSAGVFSSDQDAGYALERVISAPSVLGVTTSSLSKAGVGMRDLGAPLSVRLTTGDLSSVTDEAFLRGQNMAAIGDGSPGGWELLQFRDAVPVAPNEFEVSHRLRGQLGTEAEMREIWPVGSLFVLLTPAMQQLAVNAHGLGLPRHYRIGPGQSPVDSPSYTHSVHAFQGRGLRPYAPAHLRITPVTAGQQVSFVRRTRIDGDRWDLSEVPLGETAERYLIRVSAAGSLLRETSAMTTGWVYSDADWSADGAPVEFEIAVAQLSDRYGPGAFARRTINV